MDEELKRRLIGAGIITILAVVIVPLFFENKSRPADSGVETLALPKTSMEKPAEATTELPGAAPMATDGAVVAEKPAPRKRGYTVVPLDEPATRPAKAEPEALPSPALPDARNAQDELESPSDGDQPVEEEETPAVSAPAAVVTPAVRPQARPASPVATDAKKTVKAPKSPAAIADTHTAPIQKPRSQSVAKSSTTPAAPVSKSATKPAKPASARSAAAARTQDVSSSWVVQAGTFSTESNARVLADKLRKRNLPATVHVTQGSSGTLYRVTVGSNLNRNRAEQIQKDLEAQDGVKGMIFQNH
ncbi:MAG: SPOR domain-containing protein [Methylococcaceae bacterium]